MDTAKQNGNATNQNGTAPTLSDTISEEDTSSVFDEDFQSLFLNGPETLKSLLKDEAFFLTYQKAIQHNRKLFKDKVVLDVGCGTGSVFFALISIICDHFLFFCFFSFKGILSMFAAQAGAAKVIGVDTLDYIEDAKAIICENRLADVITFVELEDEIEKIELPDGIEKVDVILSGWMGYSLFQDCTLNNVLAARDKWLSTDGFLFPDRCSLFICGIEDKGYKEDIIDWYSKDVYGFDLSVAREAALAEPHISYVDSRRVVTSHAQLVEIDMYVSLFC